MKTKSKIAKNSTTHQTQARELFPLALEYAESEMKSSGRLRTAFFAASPSGLVMITARDLDSAGSTAEFKSIARAACLAREANTGVLVHQVSVTLPNYDGPREWLVLLGESANEPPCRQVSPILLNSAGTFAGFGALEDLIASPMDIAIPGIISALQPSEAEIQIARRVLHAQGYFSVTPPVDRAYKNRLKLTGSESSTEHQSSRPMKRDSYCLKTGLASSQSKPTWVTCSGSCVFLGANRPTFIRRRSPEKGRSNRSRDAYLSGNCRPEAMPCEPRLEPNLTRQSHNGSRPN